MGIAYSRKQIVIRNIRIDTSDNFRADLESAILAAGWLKVRDVFQHGAVYECTTPDSRNLKARLLVQDQGSHGLAGNYIIFQAMSHSETAKGQIHTIVYGNTAIDHYQVLIGRCQLFLSVPGTSGAVYLGDQSTSFAFGIPSLPPTASSGSSCGAFGTGATITDIWWANGDGNLPFFQCKNFRSAPLCFGCFDFSLNGSVTSVSPDSFTQDPSQGMLTLFYLTPTYNVDATGAQQNEIIKHSTLQPINLDATMGWQWQIRGQLWDAFQRTRPEPLDAIQSYVDSDVNDKPIPLTFQVWMSSFYTSLLLLTVSPPALAGGLLNVAY